MNNPAASDGVSNGCLEAWPQSGPGGDIQGRGEEKEVGPYLSIAQKPL